MYIIPYKDWKDKVRRGVRWSQGKFGHDKVKPMCGICTLHYCILDHNASDGTPVYLKRCYQCQTNFDYWDNVSASTVGIRKDMRKSGIPLRGV